MRLYKDQILVDCTVGEVTETDGKMAVNLTAKTWVISTSWPLWAITINDNLNLN